MYYLYRIFITINSMDDNLLVSSKIKNYLKEHELENTLDHALNEVLNKTPKDPYGLMVEIIKKSCTSIFFVQDIKIDFDYDHNFTRIPSVFISLKYKGKDYNTNFSIPMVKSIHSTDTYDTYKNIFHSIVMKYLQSNIQIETPIEIDHELEKVYFNYQSNSKGKENYPIQAEIVKSILNSISLATNIVCSDAKSIPLFKLIRLLYERDYKGNNLYQTFYPNLGLVIFSNNKVPSKVIYEKFFLIIHKNNYESADQFFLLIKKIQASIRKVLTAGKLGEAGVRINEKGCFNIPVEAINDTMKLLNDIIKDTGELGKISLGLDCNANNFYNKETLKYEIEGMKKPLSNDELIDYYYKFTNDNANISHLEDPIADEDLEGWRKLTKKFESRARPSLFSKRLSLNPDSLSRNFMYKSVPNNNENEDTANQTKQENADKIDCDGFSFNLNEFSSFYGFYENLCFARHSISDSRQNVEKAVEKEVSSSNKPTMKPNKGEIVNKDKNAKVAVWDCDYETNQNSVVDIAFGLSADVLVLNGFSYRPDRVSKVFRYLELINNTKEKDLK